MYTYVYVYIYVYISARLAPLSMNRKRSADRIEDASAESPLLSAHVERQGQALVDDNWCKASFRTVLENGSWSVSLGPSWGFSGPLGPNCGPP